MRSFETSIFAVICIVALSPTRGFAPAVGFSSKPASCATTGCLHLSAGDEASSFDAYEIGQSTLVWKDESPGEGDDVVGEGDIVTCSFAGRLYPNGYQFSKNDDFVFEVGEGKTMPGFDKALLGTRVGCKRTLRVPPSLAFGTRGNAPKIPPNADLEFDIEVKSIARGAVAGNIAKVGTGRLLGFIACFAILALSPFLPN